MQYKTDPARDIPQFIVENGSQTVIIPGVDARTDIPFSADRPPYFREQETGPTYEVASAPQYTDGDTVVTLTGAWQGDSGEIDGLFHVDFSANMGYPLFYSGDIDIPDILRRWVVDLDGDVNEIVNSPDFLRADDLARNGGTIPETDWWDSITSSWGRAFVNSNTAEAARSNLGLGTAATHNVTSGPADETEGRLMQVGDFGLGGHAREVDFGSFDTPGVTRVRSAWGNYTGTPPESVSGWTVLDLVRHTTAATQIAVRAHHNQAPDLKVYGRRYVSEGWGDWEEFYHSGNTAVDGNGFIKTASPIIRLYQNRIEHEGFFHEPPSFERLAKGVYEIRGTLGLRIDDGWYLETPTDRNGDKYFNVDWEQDVEPENENGVVDGLGDVVLTIRTFERIWNPQTGRYENGAPVDINEHQTRYISLRFNELRGGEAEEIAP